MVIKSRVSLAHAVRSRVTYCSTQDIIVIRLGYRHALSPTTIDMLLPLQYAPWLSDVELSFFSALASIKINHDKLDSSARKLLGLYEINPKDTAERSTRMQIHGNALTTDELVVLHAPPRHANMTVAARQATIVPRA